MNQILRSAVLACGMLILVAAPAALATIRPMSQTHDVPVAVADSLIGAPAPHLSIRPASETHDVPVTVGDGALVPGREVLGSSGNLRALIGTQAWLEQSLVLQPLLAGVPLHAPGVYSLGLAAPDRESLVVVSMKPLESMKGLRLDGYRVGCWHTRGLAARDPRYAPPTGYIPVTAENESTMVSKRFRLSDFLTHDQQNVWPKVLVLRVPLVDKLELIGDALRRRGLPDLLHIMSGFRTPQYNALGVGRKGGRARDSRHMYGDAADVIVDANGDGIMDDLNGDGKITVKDARVLFAIAEGVEADHPDLVGGLSAYRATSAHGPFVHVDTRGVRARW